LAYTATGWIAEIRSRSEGDYQLDVTPTAEARSTPTYGFCLSSSSHRANFGT